MENIKILDNIESMTDEELASAIIHINEYEEEDFCWIIIKCIAIFPDIYRRLSSTQVCESFFNRVLSLKDSTGKHTVTDARRSKFPLNEILMNQKQEKDK